MGSSSLPLPGVGGAGGLSPAQLAPSVSSSSNLTNNLLGAGLSGVSAGLLNQPTNTSGTSSFNSNTNQSGTSSGTSSSSTNRTLLPFQTDLTNLLPNLINNMMTNPAQYTAPFQQQARNQVNQNYSGLADSLRQQFLSTGGGSSGKFGTALAQGDLARTGDLSNVDNTFAQTNAMLPLQAESLGANLLGMNFGQTSTGSTTGSTTGSQSTSQTGTSQQQSQSGNPWLSGLGTAAGIAAMFL